MWSEEKLGHLLLLGPFRMLEAWCAWTLIMMKWLGLALGRLKPYDHLVFAWNDLTLHLEGMYLMNFWPLMLIMRIHLWWAQVLDLEWFKKQFSVSYQVEFNHRPLGLSSFIAYKVQTIMMGSSVGLGLIMVQTTAKHMYNAMQFIWTDLKVGSIGHCNMGRR